MTTFQIGDRVQYRYGGNWKPAGTVIAIEPEVTMNGKRLVSPMYKVLWDENGEQTQFISGHNFIKLSDEEAYQ